MNSRIQFVQSLLPKYPRHQTVNGDIPPPVRINILMFYLILPHSNSQILRYVMIANRRFVHQFFTCLNLLPIMTSPCFGAAKSYLRHHLQSDFLKQREYSLDIIPSWSIFTKKIFTCQYIAGKQILQILTIRLFRVIQQEYTTEFNNISYFN